MRIFRSFSFRSLVLGLLLCPALALGQDLKPIILLAPQTDGGRPLMQVLKDRHTTREFSPEKLPPQELANLLWAAYGINRPETGGRTAPSGGNMQNISIYVALSEGLYVYDAKGNKLDPILADDIRSATGHQPMVKVAPLELLYVCDISKTEGSADYTKINPHFFANAGVIAENVYLFCASEGLATVVRGGFDSEALGKLIKLSSDQKVLLVQTVGFPKK